MVKIVNFWKLREGVDLEGAEKQYLEVHVPMAKKIPGLRKYTIAKARGRNPAFYRLAELHFEDMDAAKKGLSSPKGKATLGDEGFWSRITDMTSVFCEEEEVKL